MLFTIAGKANPASPVKLITGLLYSKDEIKGKTLYILEKKFGKADFLSPELDFNYTDYYYRELGSPLKRAFVSFSRLQENGALAGIKSYTNRLEKRLAKEGSRQINIDPGFLNLSKLILATTKDYCHRIYLEKGIFAEVTLSFKDTTFTPFAWTYPDYQTREYLDIFNKIRQIYASQLKNERNNKALREQKIS